MPVQPSTISAIAWRVDDRKDQRLLALEGAQLGAGVAPVFRAPRPCPRRFRDPRSTARARGDLGGQALFFLPARFELLELRRRPWRARSMSSAWRSPCSAPVAISRSRIAASVSIKAIRRCRSSIAGGTADWLIATRAQAVSISDTALSGSCRLGDVARRQAHRLADRLVEDAHAVVLFERRDEAAHHRDRGRLVRFLDLARPGSGG